MKREAIKECHDCGESENDLQRCAGCGWLYCDDCIDWCAPKYDPPNGDYFCEGCQLESESEGDDE